MDAASGAERLATARAEVQRACDLLIAATPETLQHCQNALERARDALQELLSIAAVPAQADRSTARALRAEVLYARRLLQKLAVFYQGWERILGVMSGGYTPSGAPAAVSRQGRICCRG